jgi:hypothetical protein
MRPSIKSHVIVLLFFTEITSCRLFFQRLDDQGLDLVQGGVKRLEEMTKKALPQKNSLLRQCLVSLIMGGFSVED